MSQTDCARFTWLTPPFCRMTVLNVPEAVQTTAYPSLAKTWRNKMRMTSPSSPIERDRDQKLLLWAEYAETFSDCESPCNDEEFEV